MDLKKSLSALFILVGAISLSYGVISLFMGKLNGISWATAVLGFIFFLSGIGILKSSRSGTRTE